MRYRVTNGSGQLLCWEGEASDSEDALEQMAYDAGYRDYDECLRKSGSVVEDIVEVRPERKAFDAKLAGE